MYFPAGLFLARTALESPEFPTMISVDVMIAEHAVQPAANAISSTAPLPNRLLASFEFFLYDYSLVFP